MKDLVGPANFSLNNCATVITRKVTVPSPDPGDHSFGFTTTNVTTNPATTTSPFSLKDGESKTIQNVVVGSGKAVGPRMTPVPTDSLTSVNCDASTVPAANRTTSTTTRDVNFSIAAGETLDCTFTNTLQQRAIKITKTGKDKSAPGGVATS